MAKPPVTIRLDISDDATRECILSAIENTERLLLQDYRAAGIPGILIIEVSEDLETGQFEPKHLSELSALDPSTLANEIILTSSRNDQDILLHAMRLGVREFFVQPLNAGEVHEGLLRAIERCSASATFNLKQGTLINVVATKGGVGATTIAVNLATALKEMEKPPSVALIDLNPHFGEVAMFLDLDPEHHWGDVSHVLEQLDGNTLLSIMTEHSSGVMILPASPEIELGCPITEAIVRRPVELLKTMFDYIIIDSGQSLSSESFHSLLDLSDWVYLVAVMNLPSLTVTKKTLEAFDRMDFPAEQVRLIINRHLNSPEISIKDLKTILQKEPFWLFPNDYQASMSSLNQGRPISQANPNSPLAKSFQSMALALLGGPSEEGKKTKPSKWKFWETDNK